MNLYEYTQSKNMTTMSTLAFTIIVCCFLSLTCIIHGFQNVDRVVTLSRTRAYLHIGPIRDDEYSIDLRKQLNDEFAVEEQVTLFDRGPRWTKKLLRPVRRLCNRLISSNPNQSGNLILIKCGESELRRTNTFTGWLDPDIDDKGVQECEHAARLLLEAGYEADIIYTSRLKRAIHSVWTILQELDCVYIPVYKSWRLNERMYGALQGRDKKETAQQFGSDIVRAWRRSLKAKPPPAKVGDVNDPANDRRYSDLSREQIPLSESLKDCNDRIRPLWKYKISRELRRGNNVLVVGHANSLRGLAKIIDDIGDDAIEDVCFPSGIPFIYKFDQFMKPLAPTKGSLTQLHTSGEFLEKPGLLNNALNAQKEYFESGFVTKDVKLKASMSNLEESLLKLENEKEMEKWAERFVEHVEGEGTVKLAKDAEQFDEEEEEEEEGDDEFESDIHRGERNAEMFIDPLGQVDVQKDPVVVFIRHGTTPHNQLKLFTGWEDPPLAEAGVNDAKRAGRLLKRHGFEFDVVYTSWLSRAIQTTWHVLEELDTTWLPIIKSWRLNERHYGALTGKSKHQIGTIYGVEQLKKWRRSFDIPPPPSSSYSFSYPGNDYRRTKYVKDLRISLSETINRSIEARKFEIHRKFPKSESLKSCMARSIPFYTNKIVPEAVSRGKRVLIASHENAIRGILMHLCEIPEHAMNELHLPNGLPLIYNVRRKCISLLDEGTGKDPLEVYDFGPAAEYLFRPCELLDEDFLVTEGQDFENYTPVLRTQLTKNQLTTL